MSYVLTLSYHGLLPKMRHAQYASFLLHQMTSVLTSETFYNPLPYGILKDKKGDLKALSPLSSPC